MKRIKLFSIIILLLVLVASHFSGFNTFAKPVCAQAVSEPKVSIQMNEEEDKYIFSAYANIDSVGEIYFIVNGVKIVATEYQLILEQSDIALEVYAEAKYFDENENLKTMQSTCIVIRPASVSSEENGNTSTSKILLGGVLPALLAVGSAILLIYLCFRKKIKPIDRVLYSLKSLEQNFYNTISIIKNENLKPKKKYRLYNSSLKSIYDCISNNINIVIALNIESLGQYNSLLTNLIKFENIIKSLTVSSQNKDDNYKIKYLNKIIKITLPIIITNAEEVQKTFIISENAKNSLFVQHTKSSQNLSSEKECEKYLTNTLNLYDDDESQNDGDV